MILFSTLFELLLKFHGSPHISSANLLTCLGVVTNIAKSRAEFMARVVSAIESLYNNLPPTLTTTQVNSVRKKLKSELTGLIKHPAAFDFIDKLTPMLLDLGIKFMLQILFKIFFVRIFSTRDSKNGT